MQNTPQGEYRAVRASRHSAVGGGIDGDQLKMFTALRHGQEIFGGQRHPTYPTGEFEPDSTNAFVGSVHHFRRRQAGLNM